MLGAGLSDEVLFEGILFEEAIVRRCKWEVWWYSNAKRSGRLAMPEPEFGKSAEMQRIRPNADPKYILGFNPEIVVES